MQSRSFSPAIPAESTQVVTPKPTGHAAFDTTRQYLTRSIDELETEYGQLERKVVQGQQEMEALKTQSQRETVEKELLRERTQKELAKQEELKNQAKQWREEMADLQVELQEWKSAKDAWAK